MAGRVIVEGNLIRLWGDGQLLDEQRQGNLTRIYDVFAGSDISVANPDTDFHLFAFSDKVWLLPHDTAGVSSIIFATWRDHIHKLKLYYIADLEELPRHWRKPWLGGLLRIPEPQLLVLPSTDLPKWRLRGPLDPGAIPSPDMISKRDFEQ
jgi:hypothetical protein